MKLPKLLQAVLVVVGVYIGFKLVFSVGLHQPIPSSLLTMYMFFVVVATLLVTTATEESAKEMSAPIKALVEDPSKKTIRNIVFVLVPLLAAWMTYSKLAPSFEAPVELRTIHPAPPSSLKAYGKSFDMMKLENPFSKFQKEDPEKFKVLVKEGGDVYYKNCHFCHGDKLDGQGQYAQGFNPLPLNFQDVGTIAQLQESYLFWRIATGGPGLPKEATPWLSAMPVWKDFLTEDEIWKVILFLYDYTGQAPRSWAAH
ncbi:MAG: Cytochrome c protein [Deltaproteobacteria bacterium]|nr:Cytochrome c protein [Deltaproteobacteria bacterium]